MPPKKDAKERSPEFDKSERELKAMVSGIWAEAEGVLENPWLLSGKKTHQLGFVWGDNQVRLFPLRHEVSLPTGSIAKVRFSATANAWRLVEIKNVLRGNRTTLKKSGDTTIITVEPREGDQFWMGDIIWRFERGIVEMEKYRQPLGQPVDTSLLGGALEMKLDRDHLSFLLVYAGEDMGDPIHYLAEHPRGSPINEYLCQPMTRYLAQVFGKPMKLF